MKIQFWINRKNSFIFIDSIGTYSNLTYFLETKYSKYWNDDCGAYYLYEVYTGSLRKAKYLYKDAIQSE